MRSCRASLTILLVACAAQQCLGISWRLFSGKEECVTEWVSEAQWQTHLKTFGKGANTTVEVSGGFLVADRRGRPGKHLAVDARVLGPGGVLWKEMLNTGEEEFTLYLHDTRGPYQLCFKLSARAPNWKPSAIVKLGYFDVNIWSLKDSIPGKSADKDTAAVKTLEEVAEEAKNLPSRNELSTMHANLQWLYSQLQRVTHEQKHLLDWSDLQIANLRQSRSSSYIYSTASTVLFLATNIGCLLTVTTMMRGQSLTSAAGLPFWGKGRDLL